MAQKWYQSRMVQAAFVSALAIIIVALIALFSKNQNTSPVVINLSTTPQASPTPLPSVVVNPSPVLAKIPAQQKLIQSVNQTKEPSLFNKQSVNSNSLQEEARNNRGKILDDYIKDYIEKYSSVDLTDAPCDSEEIKKKQSAETLLGLIETLATELKRKDIVEGFVRDRRGFSIKFKDCK
jgi:hypothetical protein